MASLTTRKTSIFATIAPMCNNTVTQILTPLQLEAKLRRERGARKSRKTIARAVYLQLCRRRVKRKGKKKIVGTGRALTRTTDAMSLFVQSFLRGFIVREKSSTCPIPWRMPLPNCILARASIPIISRKLFLLFALLRVTYSILEYNPFYYTFFTLCQEKLHRSAILKLEDIELPVGIFRLFALSLSLSLSLSLLKHWTALTRVIMGYCIAPNAMVDRAFFFFFFYFCYFAIVYASHLDNEGSFALEMASCCTICASELK